MATIGMTAGKSSPKIARFTAPHTFVLLASLSSLIALGRYPILVVISDGLSEGQDHLLTVVGRFLGSIRLGRDVGGFPPIPSLTPMEGLPQRSRRKVRPT